MIDPAYVRMMARYNTWQNKQLFDILDVTNVEELTKDRGAFFGSFHATLNHLLWGDLLCINRFDPSTPSPKGDAMDSKSLFATHAEWQVERIVTDVRINAWAERITKRDLMWS